MTVKQRVVLARRKGNPCQRRLWLRTAGDKVTVRIALPRNLGDEIDLPDEARALAELLAEHLPALTFVAFARHIAELAL